MSSADQIATLAPSGYYIALRIGFAFPLAEKNALPLAWVEHYTANNYMLSDPLMRWLYQHSGAIRWSAIKISDPKKILAQAASFGLRYGVAISCDDEGPKGQRSFGTFARADREFLDWEIAQLQDKLRALHSAMAPPTNLTQAELEALRMVKDGFLVKEIANVLSVSEGAVKQRLKNARVKLGAKTGSQAVTAAAGYGLI